MRQILWMATLGFGLLLLPALPAGAQKSVTVEDVRAIAFDKGIVEIKEIELDDGLWEVEGWDPDGRKVEMKVDAGPGAVVKIERD